MLKGLEQQEIYNLLSLGITDSSDNYQIAKALLKGYKITQKELFKYLGFHYIGIESFSRFKAINWYHTIKKINWVCGGKSIVINKLEQINEVINCFYNLVNIINLSQKYAWYLTSLKVLIDYIPDNDNITPVINGKVFDTYFINNLEIRMLRSNINQLDLVLNEMDKYKSNIIFNKSVLITEKKLR